MSQVYGLEKMHMAVFNLVGPGSMNSRLANAVNSQLLHVSVDTDLPPDIRADYDAIIGGLSRHGDIQQEMKGLSEAAAERYAQKIVSLFEKCMHVMH